MLRRIARPINGSTNNSANNMELLVTILVVVDLRPKVLFYHHDVIRNKD